MTRALLGAAMDVTALRWTAVVVLAGGLVAVLAVQMRRTTRHDAALDLWGHVAELRRRILWCVTAVLAGTLGAFSFRFEPRSWYWVPVASVQDNLAAQAYRAMAHHLVPSGVQLVVLRPLDGFSAEFRVAFAIGIAVAMPVLLAQLAGFLGPALRARERRILRNAILPMVLLFAAGCALAYAVMAPLLLSSLYGYPAALGATPFLLVDELVSFTLTLMILFGCAFQTPLAMMALSRAGLIGPRQYLKLWRHAVVAILFLCALTTDGTLLTLAMVSLPLIGLYFAGVGLSVVAVRRRQAAEAAAAV